MQDNHLSLNDSVNGCGEFRFPSLTVIITNYIRVFNETPIYHPVKGESG